MKKYLDFINEKVDYDQRLIDCAYRGDLHGVIKALNNGADIHYQNDYALRWASEIGHLDVVKYLVEQGADVHALNDCALRWTSENGHLNVVKYLVEQGANIHDLKDYAIRLASTNGHLDVVKYLIEYTIENEPEYIDKIIKYLPQDEELINKYPWIYASVDHGLLGFKQFVNESQNDVFKYGDRVSFYKHPGIIKGFSNDGLYLVDFDEDGFGMHDGNGIVDMWSGKKIGMCKKGNYMWLSYLDLNLIEPQETDQYEDWDDDINEKIYGIKKYIEFLNEEVNYDQRLMNACDLDGVIDALDNGADIHYRNDCALRWASHNGHLDIVKYLIEHGANIHAWSDFAIRYAKRNHHQDVVDYLDYIIKHGIEPPETDQYEDWVEEGIWLDEFERQGKYDDDGGDDDENKIIDSNCDNKLIIYAHNGNLDAVIKALDDGANIHIIDDLSLRYASFKGHLDVVKYLIEHGADSHALDDCALRWAKMGQHQDVVDYLEYVMEHGIEPQETDQYEDWDDINENIHMKFRKYKKGDVVIYNGNLIKDGKDKKAIIYSQVGNNNKFWCEYYIQFLDDNINKLPCPVRIHRKGGIYCFLASEDELEPLETDQYEEWDDINEEVNYNEQLIDSARHGHLDGVIKALNHGANIHAQNDRALRWASNNGHLDIVKYLVEQEADVHAYDDDALQWASRAGHLDVVKYLVEHGADVHALNDSALQSASYKGHLDVVKYLVEQGADIHAQNDYALKWAKKRRHQDVVDYLKYVMEHGTEPSETDQYEDWDEDVNENNKYDFQVGDKVIYYDRGRKKIGERIGEILDIQTFDSLGTLVLMLFDDFIIQGSGAFSYTLKKNVPNTIWVSIKDLTHKPVETDQYEEWDDDINENNDYEFQVGDKVKTTYYNFDWKNRIGIITDIIDKEIYILRDGYTESLAYCNTWNAHEYMELISPIETDQYEEWDEDIVNEGINYDQHLINNARHGHLHGVIDDLDNGADIHAQNDYALRYAKFNHHQDVVDYLKYVMEHSIEPKETDQYEEWDELNELNEYYGMINKYKVGDRVRVKDDLIGNKNYDGVYCNKDMLKHCGKNYIVTCTNYTSSVYSLIPDDGDEEDGVINWNWGEMMLEPYVEIPEDQYEEWDDDINEKIYGIKKYLEFLNEKVDYNERLINSAHNGDLDGVIDALNNGADIHYKYDFALRWASEIGHLDVVKYLVEQGADVHALNDCALRWTSENGHLDVVKYLVEQGADVHALDDWGLRWAKLNHHQDVVDYLEYVIKHGIEPQETDQYEDWNDDVNEGINYDQKLINSAHRGNLHGVINALNNGADIHYKYDFVLRWASFKGHLDVVKYLIEHGANIHARNDYALRLASVKGHLDVVKCLIEHGADVHAQNDYALRLAKRNQHQDVVDYLTHVMEFGIEHQETDQYEEWED